jgi:hypothetical protein
MRVQGIAQWTLGFAAASLVTGTVAATPAARPSASANFTSEGSGCITTEAAVFVRGLDVGPGPARLNLRIVQADDCADRALVNTDAKANLGEGAFRVSPDASSATLNAIISVADRATGRRLNATIRLTWTATEDAVVADTPVEPEELGRFLRARGAPFRRTLRLARASGVVSLGTANLTSEATEDAWISLTGPAASPAAPR